MNRFVVTAGLLLVLAGCGYRGIPVEDSEQLWQARQLELAAVEEWNMRARAVLRFDEEAYQVGFSWRREADRFALLFEAPFGQGVIRIERHPAGDYSLRLPDGRVFRNDSADALMDQMLGWSIPIGGLEYWIRSLPRPDGDYTRRIGDSGSTRSLRQDRWVIDYLDYFEIDPELPRRINLARDGVALRLVVEHWQPAKIEGSEPGLFPEFD